MDYLFKLKLKENVPEKVFGMSKKNKAKPPFMHYLLEQIKFDIPPQVMCIR